jgi:hypothetical protein
MALLFLAHLFSGFTSLVSLLGVDFHALPAQHLTASGVQIPIDRHATLKANTHATKRATQFTCD